MWTIPFLSSSSNYRLPSCNGVHTACFSTDIKGLRQDFLGLFTGSDNILFSCLYYRIRESAISGSILQGFPFSEHRHLNCYLFSIQTLLSVWLCFISLRWLCKSKKCGQIVNAWLYKTMPNSILKMTIILHFPHAYKFQPLNVFLNFNHFSGYFVTAPGFNVHADPLYRHLQQEFLIELSIRHMSEGALEYIGRTGPSGARARGSNELLDVRSRSSEGF